MDDRKRRVPSSTPRLPVAPLIEDFRPGLPGSCLEAAGSVFSNLQGVPPARILPGGIPEERVVERMQSQRFEFKYLVDEPTARSVRDFVQGHLDLDAYGARMPDWSYPVHSLYLDSPDLGLCRSTINGDRNRFKMRLRFYENHPASPVYLEIKRRKDNCIFKKRCGIHPRAVAGILAGHVPDPGDRIDGPDCRPGFLEEYLQLITRLGAAPVAHVAYRREAWISPADNSVRVTLDREVFWDEEDTGSPDVRMRHPVRVFGDQVVVELKFTDRFPAWFGDLVRTHHLVRCGAAKYVDGATLVGMEPGRKCPVSASFRDRPGRRERLLAAYHQ